MNHLWISESSLNQWIISESVKSSLNQSYTQAEIIYISNALARRALFYWINEYIDRAPHPILNQWISVNQRKSTASHPSLNHLWISGDRHLCATLPTACEGEESCKDMTIEGCPVTSNILLEKLQRWVWLKLRVSKRMRWLEHDNPGSMEYQE